MYPWHATVREGTQYVQLNNREQENKKHQANLLAWLKWEAFLVLKKIHPDLLLLQVMFFHQLQKGVCSSRTTGSCQLPVLVLTKAFLANLPTTNKPEAARGWGSSSHEEHTASAMPTTIRPSWCLSNITLLWMGIFSKELWRTHVVCLSLTESLSSGDLTQTHSQLTFDKTIIVQGRYMFSMLSVSTAWANTLYHIM